MKALIKYETKTTELYQWAAEQFKKFKEIIKSLGLTLQKFVHLVDEVTDLPRSDANTKYHAFSYCNKSKKLIRSTYGYTENRYRRRKNKRTEYEPEEVDSTTPPKE
jgi:hypothetical protein